MKTKQEIVKQYVASLKEDRELDYIFPLLLERMGFRVLSTPKQSKGQSQYGRDVIAVKREKGINTLFLFELKGFRAKDINDKSLNETDGLIESMRASKNTLYRDASIPDLDTYARKYVFVHNGYIEANSVATLDGFVSTDFPEKNFERWGLDKLTELFSKYLFEETILTDSESYRLFKKVLVLLDSEGNDYSDIVSLVERQIELVDSHKNLSKRTKLNFFATLRLIGGMVYYYAEDADNLYPAKFCMDTIVLKTWGWILRRRLDDNSAIKTLFFPIVVQQLSVYEAYLNKILESTNFKNGFYGFVPHDTEKIFYPLRCYDFLNDLLYYYHAMLPLGTAEQDLKNRKLLVKTIIDNNDGFKMPLLDTHSIPILLLFRFFMIKPEERDYEFVAEFLVDSVLNVVARYKDVGMWPEMTGNRKSLAKSLYSKSDDYHCESSLLLTTLVELLAYIGAADYYKVLRQCIIDSGVNLQVAYPIHDEYDIESELFRKRLYEELAVETGIQLPETLEEFQETFSKAYDPIEYRTDKAGFFYLRILAHIYYQTDFFPDFLGKKFCRATHLQ